MADFRAERDWKIGFLVVALGLTILLVFVENLDETVDSALRLITVALIGSYGGVRGQGSTENEKNTFGIPSGAVRATFGFLFLVIFVIYGFTETTQPNTDFLIVTIGELLGISIPGLYNARPTPES